MIELSRAVRRTILTNLLWAFAYNAIGLVLAASGHLQPVIAALLMAGSSLLVVVNSLRLERSTVEADCGRMDYAAYSDKADCPRDFGRSARQPEQLSVATDHAIEGRSTTHRVSVRPE